MRSLKKERDELNEVVESYKTSIAEMEHELLLPKEDYIEKYAEKIDFTTEKTQKFKKNSKKGFFSLDYLKKTEYN